MRRLLAGVCVFAAVSAQAATLDFDYSIQAMTTEDPMGVGPLQGVGVAGWISQSYGDVAGLVDMSYLYFEAGQQLPSSSLTTWNRPGFDDLRYTAWAGYEVAGDTGQVSLASVDGSLVSLNSFDLGVWNTGRGVPEIVRVFEIGRLQPVFTQAFSDNANQQHHTFDVNLQSTSGFVIRWSSPYWAAIDNIVGSVAAVPEPGTVALMLAGMLVVVGRVRRR